MRKLGLVVLVIFLTVSCSSCRDFEWEARPYVGDSTSQSLINGNGESVRCDEPAFDEMTAFDADNMAELIAAIDQVNMSKKSKEKLKYLFIKSFMMDKKGREKLRSE